MASIIAEADVYNATMTAPDDGDTRSAASVTAAGVGFQVAADRTNYLRNRNVGALGGNMPIPLCGFEDIRAGQWEPSNTPEFTWNQIGAIANIIYFPIPHVYNATITGLVARVHGDPNGVGPHVGALGTMPILGLWVMNSTTGVGALVGQQVDTTVAPATYEVMHSITLSVAAQTFSDNLIYYAKVTGEGGANALGDAFHVYSIYATIVAA